MNIGNNAKTVLERRYLIKNDKGEATESIEDLFARVASAIAAPDKNYDQSADVDATARQFYNVMTSLDFLPNSPTLMNAGRPLGQLSACFVLPVDDSMEDIFESIKQAALIHKSGGGTGFSFSRIRPKGSTVNSTGGVASGPVSFMRVFNMATEAVKQGGTRRGANMGILRVDHPDILEFIDCKKTNADITNFNISVGLTEEFMCAAEKGHDYPLIDPATGETTGTLNATEILDKIVDCAWRNGEPGIILLDRLNRDNVLPTEGEIESTNPCGEQPLLPYESCNLGSINLTNMVKKDGGKVIIDWDKLEETTRIAVHFLDNVIDANRYPLAKIDEVTKKARKIGMGVMGWADLLLLLSLPYNSDEAITLAEQVMGFINRIGRDESNNIARTRGTFPLFEVSALKDQFPTRNATVTTIAPTGTLSIIAGVSSGVEPVFAYVYVRNVMDNTEMIEVNPILKEVLQQRGLYSDGLMKQIAAEGSITHITEIPEDIRRIFVSAHDISPEYHIRMQAAFQNHTDNAVSKTVNFGKSATTEDVKQAYVLAYTLGCKGVTIYRDGSRDDQVLNIGGVPKAGTQIAVAGSVAPRPRPETTNGFTERVKIGCGNLYITVNYDENGACEIFTNTGRAGGCPSQSEATARLVSIALRSGINVESIISQLKGIRCPSTIRQQGMKCTSCPDAIGRALERLYQLNESANNGLFAMSPAKDAVKAPVTTASSLQVRDCPECGKAIEHEGGCITCRNCGFSKCG